MKNIYCLNFCGPANLHNKIFYVGPDCCWDDIIEECLASIFEEEADKKSNEIISIGTEILQKLHIAILEKGFYQANIFNYNLDVAGLYPKKPNSQNYASYQDVGIEYSRYKNKIDTIYDKKFKE